MQKIFRLLVLGSLLLSACSAIPASPQPIPTVITDTPLPLPTTAVPGPKPMATLGTPHIDQPPDIEITHPTSDSQNCGYQWAYQDLPELFASFEESLQALQPAAQARVFVFGENCVLSDGTVDRFIPMETDFNITLQVTDVENESDLGEWIVKVMQVITSIPPEQIMGPRPGRVSLIFQSGTEQQGVSFYIDQFQGLPAGSSTAEIFQSLKVSQ